jgi:hypothetical protein
MFTEHSGAAGKLWICIRDVSASNLVLDIGYHEDFRVFP